MNISSIDQGWLIDKIEEYLLQKGKVFLIANLSEFNSKEISPQLNEIQQAIDKYNFLVSNDDNLRLCINAQHLLKIFDKQLPSYVDVVKKLKNRNSEQLKIDVFSELRDSSYFKEVYEIDNSQHLLINILILIYRTSLLYTYPSLRENKAQISSTIEEMAALLHLENKKTNLFQATKHWIKNWKEEEFSLELADLVG